MTTPCRTLVVPTGVEEKVRLLTDNTTGLVPVPDKGIVWGLVTAPYTAVTAPVRTPPTVGLKRSVRVQLAPLASEVMAQPDLVKSPEIVMLEMERRVSRLLVMVMESGPLVVPTSVLGKFTLAGVNVTGGVPLPLSDTDSTPALESSVIVNVAVVFTVVVARKFTDTVQVCPAGIGDVHGLVTWNWGSLTAVPRMFNGRGWLFLIATVSAVLSSPSGQVPNARFAGVSLTGTTPVPDNGTSIELGTESLLTLSVPVRALASVGANATVIEQLKPGCSTPQVVPVRMKSPLMTDVTVIGVVRAFLTVTLLVVVLVKPTAVFGNDKLAGVTVGGVVSADEFTVIPVCEPAMPGETTSAAEIDCTPAVCRVALNRCDPASADTNV